MRTLALIVGLAAALLSGPTQARDRIALNDEFHRSMEKWSSFQLVSYRYDFQMSIGSCKYPKARVTVRDSEVSAARYIEDGKDCKNRLSKGDKVALEAPFSPTTIAGLFAQIINIPLSFSISGLPRTSADYDSKYGFPKVFRVYSAMGDNSRDYEFYVSNFRAAQ